MIPADSGTRTSLVPNAEARPFWRLRTSPGGCSVGARARFRLAQLLPRIDNLWPGRTLRVASVFALALFVVGSPSASAHGTVPGHQPTQPFCVVNYNDQRYAWLAVPTPNFVQERYPSGTWITRGGFNWDYGFSFTSIPAVQVYYDPQLIYWQSYMQFENGRTFWGDWFGHWGYVAAAISRTGGRRTGSLLRTRFFRAEAS